MSPRVAPIIPTIFRAESSSLKKYAEKRATIDIEEAFTAFM